VATRTEANVVYAAGLVQGVVLVTFPAASTIFTDPREYALSSTQYGTLFLPQVVTAVAASLAGGSLARRFGAKRIYLVGLLANMASMLLLFVSRFFASDHALAYGLLLAATACLGAGFGLTTPAINTLTAAFHPLAVDTSVLTLNALLGLGTALAPVFVAVFVGLGFWWGLPVLSAALLVVLVGVSLPLPLRAGTRAEPEAGAAAIPARFWLFAAFALLYGFCETMNGNWAEVDMTKHLGASATVAALALTAFWGMVTAGRVLFALVQRWFPTSRTYRLLPFVLVVTFVVTAVLPAGTPGLGVLAFGLAGLGCSALLPLTISFGQEQLVVMSASVAGGVIALYQVGYGVAAFGAGPLQNAGVALPLLFGLSAFVAGALGGLAFLVTGQRPAVSRVHPRP
jgi:fucose permease